MAQLESLEFYGMHHMTVRQGDIIILRAVGENWPNLSRACLALLADIACDTEDLDSFDLMVELERMDLAVESVDSGDIIIVSSM